MDLKVLTAVFFTLAVIIVGTNTGMIDGSMLEDLQEDGLSGLLDGLFSGFESRPEPNISVELEVEYRGKEDLKIRDADVMISNLTRYAVNEVPIDSDGPITFAGLTGDSSFSNMTRVSGEADRLLLHGGGSVNRTVELDYSGSTDRVKMQGQEKVPVSVENATVRLISDSVSGTYRNRSLSIDSFSGNMTVFPGNKTILLSGQVHRLSVGELKIGP